LQTFKLAAIQVTGSVTDSGESEPSSSGLQATQQRLSSAGIGSVSKLDMFTDQQISRWSPQLLAYLPIGVALALARSLLWIVCIAVDAPWFRKREVIDTYLSLLGVRVVWEGEENIPKDESHVLVSNHLSVGDLMMLFTRPHRYVHLITAALPGPVYGTKHLPVILKAASKESYEELANALHTPLTSMSSFSEDDSDGEQDSQHKVPSWLIKQSQMETAARTHTSSSSSSSGGGNSHSSSSSSGDTPSTSFSHHHLGLDDHIRQHHPQHQGAPLGHQQQPKQQEQQGSESPDLTAIHVFPEGGMTNGKAMMHFSRGFMRFAAPLPVVPVALRLIVPFKDVTSHTWTSGFLNNLFWFSFQPWCELRATALPVMRYSAIQSKSQFVQEVQLAIAEELGVWVSDLKIQQKKQMAKRKASRK
jgi:hypothetical protein